MPGRALTAEEKHLRALVGGTVSNVIFDGDETYGIEVTVRGPNGRPKHLAVWILRDPEGNGPGHLDIEEFPV